MGAVGEGGRRGGEEGGERGLVDGGIDFGWGRERWVVGLRDLEEWFIVGLRVCLLIYV